MPSSRLLPLAIAAALCAGLAALAAFLISADNARAVAPTELQIAFSETVDGNTDIYLRDPAGTRRTRRTQNPGDDFAPAWSPVGDQFAYVRLTSNGSRYHLRVQNVTTDRDTRLMSERFAFGRPAFTRDGTAVISATETGLLEVPVDNPGARRVIGSPSDDSTDPAVDPTSSNLVVSRPRAGGRALALIDDQGALLQWLTDGASIDTLPAFTPDGTDIYFARRAIGEPVTKNQIYRVAADGSQASATAVTIPAFFNWATSPSVSPDGAELIFEAAQGGIGERMYILDTANPLVGIRFLALGVGPAWRPNGWYYRRGSELLGDWIRSLQFTGNQGKGAIRVHQDPGAPPGQGATTGDWYQVVPYRASLAVLGLLRAPETAGSGERDKFQVAEDWIDWYLDHLNTDVPVTDPDYGVVYDHWYRLNGGEESLQPAGGGLCHDAADSYAATLLMAARAYLEEGGDPAFFDAQRMSNLRIVAGVITGLQQPEDGLTWARAGADCTGVDGRTKFLMDNAETYRGLRAMAWIEGEVSGNPAAGDSYDVAADAVRDGFNGFTGIQGELFEFNTQLYSVAKFAPVSPGVQDADPTMWFPNGIAHTVWPHLMGVISPSDPVVAIQFDAINALDTNSEPVFPWTSQIVDPNNMPWSSMGYASLLAGDATRAKEQAEFLLADVLDIASNDPLAPTYPFLADDAGWLLQTLAELQAG